MLDTLYLWHITMCIHVHVHKPLSYGFFYVICGGNEYIDLSYPASLYPDLSLSGRDLAVIFFLCVYNNTGKRGISNSIRISQIYAYMYIIPNIINIHSHQIFF